MGIKEKKKTQAQAEEQRRGEENWRGMRRVDA
jgi:hypothetical protein